MPGSAKDRKSLKTSIQQRQEQQRDRPTSTAKTSGGGIGGQQRQGVTVQFQPDNSDRHDRFASQMTLHDTPEQAFAAYDAQHPAPFVDFSTAHSLLAPTPAQVGEEVERLLAPLPRHDEPLTPAQDAALDLLDRLASDLAHRITDPASVHALIDRLPDLGTGCGRAVANALREAQ